MQDADITGWAQIVSLLTVLAAVLTALAAVGVGPLVQWKIASKQLRASNISSKRQNWIDELRKEVAELLQQIARLEELKGHNPSLSADDARALFDERVKAEFRAGELAILIRLRLNPNEQAHKDLLRALNALAAASKRADTSETEDQLRAALRTFADARECIVMTTQKILKTEWDRVRRGE